jgi:anti-anti-sigma regulatory factor
MVEPGVVYADVSPEPRLRGDLESLRRQVRGKDAIDAIVSFSRVDVVQSPSIGSLILLRKALHERGQRLILCNVGMATHCILYVAGLHQLFEVAEDKVAALALLRRLQQQKG